MVEHAGGEATVAIADLRDDAAVERLVDASSYCADPVAEFGTTCSSDPIHSAAWLTLWRRGSSGIGTRR